MKIKVFHHILLENHWFSVVTEQYRLIRESKMLDDISEFYITLSYEERNKSSMINAYYNRFVSSVFEEDLFYGKKVDIIEYKKEDFEYPTLEKAIHISNESTDFVGFYLHTKGVANVSTSNEIMRHSLNEGCINYWREHLSAIQSGYDMSGVNLLHHNPNKIKGEPASNYYKTFYSGNFFYFNPAFLKQIDFSKIDKKNRFWAESIYGFFYEPKCNNVGYVQKQLPFLKTGNIEISYEQNI